MKKYKVGFTAGAFDLCHAGHMLMFKDCKRVCEYLIVALHTDPSLEVEYRKLAKNQIKNRPVMTVAERMAILEGIRYVDEIITYSTEADLRRLLETTRFDVRILGSDWKGRQYTGWEIPHVAYFHERSHNYSTSDLRSRIYQAELERLESMSSKAVPAMERF
ncbi:MAG TPA: adenylyltransferase/cytidyltransferase family protein [Candidatus Paceibacterota bacterium]|nr:adenylyltransferase/cytidyltransferase family protein [Candidatus Paceibacterota bacterium]